MPEHVQTIIRESEPCIPTELLELIASLDPSGAEISLDDLKPTLICRNDEPGEIIQTRAGEMSFTGYRSAWSIYHPIEVTLTSYNTSAFRQCIEFTDGGSLNGFSKYKLSFYSLKTISSLTLRS